ncbi:MAG: CBS domain-containing protein [bacterium]|nr:CBS domain-containing protein [bacterium]
MKPNMLNILQEKGGGEFSVTPDVTVFGATPLMKKNHGAVAVLDGEKLVGIFTERDCLNKVVLGGLSPEKTLVKEMMTRKVIFAAPDITVGKALDIMTENNIRHLPIIENEKVMGMVYIFDLVKRIIEEQKKIISHLTEYIELSY